MILALPIRDVIAICFLDAGAVADPDPGPGFWRCEWDSSARWFASYTPSVWSLFIPDF